MKNIVPGVMFVVLCLLCVILCVGVFEISPLYALFTGVFVLFLYSLSLIVKNRRFFKELVKEKNKQSEEWEQITQKFSDLSQWQERLELEQQIMNSAERSRENIKRNYDELCEKRQKLYNDMQEGLQALENAQNEVTRLEEESASLREELENGEKAKAELLNILATLKMEHETLEIDNEKTIRLLRNYADEREKQRNFIETSWRNKIENGNLAENISLRSRNRKNFFIYIKLKETNEDGSCTYRSEPFGNAKDAKMFGDSLEDILKTQCKIREGERRGEYVVWIERYPSEMMSDYYQKHADAYEFSNPAFDDSPDNHEIISDEKRMLMAIPNQKGYKTGEDYEKYVAERLAAGGYMNIALTPTSNDYGADVICEKDGVKYCVQCKMYSNPVGVSAVQEIVTAKAHYQCERAMVITNNIFTAQAKKLASENAVILVDEFT